MNFNIHLLIKRTVLATAIAAGAAGIAHADDSSMNPFTGDSYAYFNGTDARTQPANPVFDNAPSAWRQANPQGVPERVIQSYSAPGEAWHMTHPSLTSAPSDPSFKQTHPNGLTEPELEALSSEAFERRLGGENGIAAIAESQNHAMVVDSATQESPGQRMASFFHRSQSSSTQ